MREMKIFSPTISTQVLNKELAYLRDKEKSLKKQ